MNFSVLEAMGMAQRFFGDRPKELIGSTAILGMVGNDIDILVWVRDIIDARDVLRDFDFDIPKASGEEDGWTSAKRGNLNFIITDDPHFYQAQVQACRTLTMLNTRYGLTSLVSERAFRVAVHKIGDQITNEILEQL